MVVWTFHFGILDLVAISRAVAIFDDLEVIQSSHGKPSLSTCNSSTHPRDISTRHFRGPEGS